METPRKKSIHIENGEAWLRRYRITPNKELILIAIWSQGRET